MWLISHELMTKSGKRPAGSGSICDQLLQEPKNLNFSWVKGCGKPAAVTTSPPSAIMCHSVEFARFRAADFEQRLEVLAEC